MATANREFDYVPTAPTQGEVAVNGDLDKLDGALSAQLSVAISISDVDASSGSNKTDLLKSIYVKFTNTLTADRAYLLPSNKCLFIAEHANGGAFNITVKRSGQTGVLLRPGEKKLIYNDGTDARLRGDFTTRLGIYQAGKPNAGQVMLRFKAPFALTFKAGMPGAKASHKTNPTATATFTCKKNGSSFGTVDIGTGGAYTFTQAADSVFAEDDVLTIEAPGSQDATLDDVNLIFPAVR